MNIFKIVLATIILTSIILFTNCKKEEPNYIEKSANLSIDSITTPKKTIKVWEQIYVTAHTRGQNLKFQWNTNHGSMYSTDSATVIYYACPTCLGTNIIECQVTNSYGTVKDTIMVHVY